MAGPVTVTQATGDSPVTLRAKSTLISTVYGIAFNFFFHGRCTVFSTSAISLAVGKVCGVR